MILSDIYTYVKERAAGLSESQFLAEASTAWARVWYSSDLPDALFEYDIDDTAERVIILPWFVYQLKGVRPAYEYPRKLVGPRPYYGSIDGFQSHYEWRMLHRTPLLKSIEAAGQLTFRPRKVLTSQIILSIRGPGNFGVIEHETLTLPANTDEVTSAAAYSDVSMLSKSTVTAADIEVFDIQGNQIAILPSDRTDVFCQVVRLLDRNVTVTVQSQNAYYTILYKAHPPQFVSLQDSLPSEYGLVLRDEIVSQIVGGRTDKDALDIADRIGGRAGNLMATIRSSQEQGASNPMDMGGPRVTRKYCGHL